MDVATNSFGQWMKGRRLARDLTQRELAELVGCSLITIQKLEAGRRRPSRQIVERLADALLVPGEERAAFLRLGRAQRREAAAAPPSRSSHQFAALRVPVPPTPLLGRDAELAALLEQLAGPLGRLVTLVGVAGVGKTRLATEAALRFGPALRDGAAFVALDALRDPELLPEVVAHALGLQIDGPTPLAALSAALAPREQLLVLDNFEQIVAAAPLVSGLLRACPGLRVLVTSRERLRVRGEQLFPLEPLALQPPGALHAAARPAPAVALFCALARAVRPGFAPQAGELAEIAEICARLDGLPLAIEIAAAHMDTLTPSALLAQLDSRIALTLDGPRDLPPRQRTLWAAFDWSYALLEPDARRLLARLAVLAGGWDLAAAAAIDADPAGAADLRATDLRLATLLHKSLVQRLDGMGHPRLALLETVREYALAQLDAGEAQAARTAHAAYFLTLAEEARPQLGGADQQRWIDRLSREQANLRAALEWLLATQQDGLAARLAVALNRFWWMRGQLGEARRWYTRLLARADTLPPRLQAELWHARGTAEAAQGDHDRAEASLRRGLAVAQAQDDAYTLGMCAHGLGLVLSERGSYDEARQLLELGLAIDEAQGDLRGRAISLGSLGGLAYQQGDYRQARQLLEAALALQHDLGDLHSAALTLNNLGEIARRLDDDDASARYLAEGLELARRLDGRRMLPYLLNNLGVLNCRRGATAAAQAAFGEALALLAQTGDRAETLTSLLGCALLALELGSPERAARLLGAVAGSAAADTPFPRAARDDHASLAGRAQAALGVDPYRTLSDAGRALSLEQAVALALAP